MSGKEIHEAVARATGEDVRTIAWLGFVLLDPMPTGIDEDGTEAGISRADASFPVDEIDWDDVDLERYLAMCG
jgi:hypothetical protein